MGRVVTFYSYKGGVGRSFLLANVATLLANWGYRVLAIDWDLEAPGLGHYFAPYMEKQAPGVVDLVEAYANGRPANWVTHVNRVLIPQFGAKLDFVAAGLPDDRYMKRAQDLDWTTLYEKMEFGRYLENLRENWKYIYDFILIDSRTGISDLAGISTVHLPDLLVFLFTANNQSLEGAVLSAQRMIASRNALPFDREHLQCLPVLSRFAVDKEYATASTWMQKIEQATSAFFDDWRGTSVSVASIYQQTRVPEVAFWTFGERLPVVEDQKANFDPQAINFSMYNIAGLIARNLGGVQQLLLSRDSFLAGSAKENSERGAVKAGSEQAIPVFISSTQGNRDVAIELGRLLEQRGLDIRGEWQEATGEDWRTRILSELRIARYLIVLLSGPPSEQQTTEIQGFFALTVNTSQGSGIIPVVLNDEGLQSVPTLLSQFQIIDGRSITREQLVEKCLSMIELAATARTLHLV